MFCSQSYPFRSILIFLFCRLPSSLDLAPVSCSPSSRCPFFGLFITNSRMFGLPFLLFCSQSRIQINPNLSSFLQTPITSRSNPVSCSPLLGDRFSCISPPSSRNYALATANKNAPTFRPRLYDLFSHNNINPNHSPDNRLPPPLFLASVFACFLGVLQALHHQFRHVSSSLFCYFGLTIPHSEQS